MPISDSLFAHIHNDAHLVGTKTLEGQDFSSTIDYLEKFIEHNHWILKQSYGLSLREKLKNLKKYTAKLNALRFEVRDITSTEVNEYPTFKELTEEIYYEIYQVATLGDIVGKESVLMPGGWNNASDGHAMVYEFKRDQDDIIFIIHNSGAGLDYHQKTQELDKERFCPILAYRIPKESIENKEIFSWYIGELLKLRLPLKNKKQYNEKTLYEEILPQIIFLNGVLEDGFKNTKQDTLTAGQRSGTCAEKCLHQMIENAMPNKKDYKNFMYHFKKYSLEDYIKEVERTGRADHPAVRNQISLAIENMARLLLKEDYFDAKTRKREVAFLMAKQKLFPRISVEHTVNYTQEDFISELNEYDVQENTYNDKISPSFPVEAEKPPPPSTPVLKISTYPEILFDFNTDDINEEIKIFHSAIEDLRKKDLEAAEKSLEYFFTHFPLPPETTHTRLKEQWKTPDTFETLGSLNTLYADVYQKNNGNIITHNHIITQLSFVAALATLHNDDFFEIISRTFFSPLEPILNNGFFSAENFQSDTRLIQLRELLQTKEAQPVESHYRAIALSEKIKEYYEAILKRHTLFDELSSYYEEDRNTSSKKIKICNSGRGDVRALYFMNEYLENTPHQKEYFIKDLSKYCGNSNEATRRLQEAEKDFRFQHTLELMIANAANSIIKTKNVSHPKLINIERDGYSSTPITSPLNPILSGTLHEPFSNHKENDNTIRSIIRETNLNPNHNQIDFFSSKKQLKYEHIKSLRELLHIKSSSFQLKALFDFFRVNLHLLEDKDILLYFEKTIFHPLLFNHALDNEPETITELEQLIAIAVDFYSKSGKPDFPALRLNEIALQMLLYSREHYSTTLQTLMSDLQTVDNKHLLQIKIIQTKETIDALDQKILAKQNSLLHDQERYSDEHSIMQSLSFQQAQVADIMSSTPLLLNSLFMFKYYGADEQTDDPQKHVLIKDLFRKLQLNIESLNAQDPNYIKEVIPTLLIKVPGSYTSKINKENIDNFIWDIKLPFITIIDKHSNEELCFIDLSKGEISKSGSKHKALPQYVLNSPIYSNLFGHFNPISLTSIDDSCFEFTHKENNYRIISDENKNIVIQKEINVSNQGVRWYQLEKTENIDNIQTIFKDKNNIAWLSVIKEKDNPPDIIIENTSSDLIYRYETANHTLSKLTSNYADSGERILDSNSPLHKLVSHFEDSQFVIVSKDQNGLYQIKLPRYNLILHAVKVDKQWHVSLANTEYNLKIPDTTTVHPPLQFALIFESKNDKKAFFPIQKYIIAEPNLDSKKQNDFSSRYYSSSQFSEYQEILPVNPAPITPNVKSEYYQLKPDISNKVKSEKSSIATYEKTEQYFSYQLDNETLIPQDMEAGLYLTYLFLCNHQPEKAFEMLEYCKNYFGELSGTENEIEFINYIVNSIPEKLKDAKKVEIETPAMLSVKLKALQLLASFKQNNPGFHESSDFYTSLSKTIARVYHHYHHTQANVPNALTLSNHEKLTLLRSIYLTEKKPAEGPVGVVWRKLEIDNLESELMLLQEKEKSYRGSPPSQLTHDIENIKRILDKEKIVLASRSEIKNDTLIINLNYSNLNTKVLNIPQDSSLDKELKYNMPVEISLSTLHQYITTPPFDDLKFIICMPKIINSIVNNTLTPEVRKQLVDFLEKAIAAYHDNESFKKESNLLQLYEITYTLISNIDKIKDYINKENIRIDKERSSSKQSSYLKNIGFPVYDDNFISWLDNIKNIINLSGENKFELPIVSMTESEQPLTNTKALRSVLPIQKSVTLQPFNVNNISVEHVLNEHCREYYHKIGGLKAERDSRFKTFAERFKEIDTIDDFIIRSEKMSVLDNEAGTLENIIEGKRSAIAIEYLGHAKIRKNILISSQKAFDDLSKRSKHKLDAILTLANKNFSIDPQIIANPDLQLALMGRKTEHLKLNDLLELYLHGDLIKTMEKTALTEEECTLLHNEMTEYLALNIEAQQFKRIAKEINALPNKKVDITKDSSFEEKETLARIGELIAEKNLIEYHLSPALTIFQYDQDILIREQQKKYIEDLLEKDPDSLSFHNTIIQLIMGGGKSKVLLPILALKKTTGDNLSIIEVPEALYKTNLADLNKISMRLFGKAAFGLHFTRDTPCEALDLKLLYRKLKFTGTHQGYVVTTHESMASLKLKYYELLRTQEHSPSPEIEKQIKWLDRILNFIHDRGDVLIDEVDSSLDSKKHLNYTIGEPQSISTADITGIVKIYQTLSAIPYENGTLLDLALDQSHTSENISQITTALSEMFEEDDYFNDLLKIEINHLLEHTLSLKLFQNYGPSKNVNKTALERLVTIPYGGNDDPREKSKDSNHLKTINLTVQSTLLTGLPPTLIISLFKEWIEDAKKELLENPLLNSLEDTTTGKTINSILQHSGLPLSLKEINVDNYEITSLLTERLKNNREFIFHVLENAILPQIKIHDKALSSNSHSYPDMYHSKQGITGTPWNWRTMQSFSFNPLASLGTDGLTIARLRSKHTPVHVLNFDTVSQFLKLATQTMSAPQNLRAIIDVGATFRGISNKKVADELSQFFKKDKRYRSILKYVLYFDKDPISGMDELFALPIDNQQGPISLKGKTSAEISKILNCTPNEYFTYYDQIHTIGADIKQSYNAKAILTVGDTITKDMCQGAMRLRDLKNAQTIEVFISENTAKAISSEKKPVINDIIELAENNQKAKQLNDNFNATLEALKNIIAYDLDIRILKAPVEKKSFLFNTFQAFFSQTLPKDFIKQNASNLQKEETINIFNEQALNLISSWESLLQLAKLPTEETKKQELMAILQNTLTTALRNCDKHTLYMPEQNLNQTSEFQNEAESQKSVEKEIEKNVQQEHRHELQSEEGTYTAGHRRGNRLISWIDKIPSQNALLAYDFTQLIDTSFWDSSANKSIQSQVSHNLPKFYLNPNKYGDDKIPLSTSGFDNSIKQSYNFKYTNNADIDETIELNDQKHIHTVLMMQTEHELKAIILTYPEADAIKSLLTTTSPVEPPNYIWVTNTRGSILSGNKPSPDILHPSYNRIMQQLRFYNGNLAMLIRDDLNGSWLMENFDEKLTYLNKNILPFRLSETSLLTILQNKTKKLHSANELIIQGKNQTDYSDLSSSDIHSLEKLNIFITKLDNHAFKAGITPEFNNFITPYYFRLLQNDKHQTRFKNYVNLVPDDLFGSIITEQLNEIHIKKDYSAILALYHNPAFSDPAKNQLFKKTLGQMLTNRSFSESLCAQGNDKLIHQIVALTLPEDKNNFIKSLSKESFSALFTKDLEAIKPFFKHLNPQELNLEFPIIQPIRTKTKQYDLSYIIDHPEKFELLLNLSNQEYLKAFSTANQGAIFELLSGYCTDGKTAMYMANVERFIKLVVSALPSDALWNTGLEIEHNKHQQSLPGKNALEFLNNLLPHDAFLQAIKQDPRIFLAYFSEPTLYPHLDYIWETFFTPLSDVDKLEVSKAIQSKLSYRPTTFMSFFKDLKPKPAIYYRMALLEAEPELIEYAKKVDNDMRWNRRSWYESDLASALENYIQLMNEKPDALYLKPLSLIMLEWPNETISLSTVIEKCSDDNIKNMFASAIKEEAKNPKNSSDSRKSPLLLRKGEKGDDEATPASSPKGSNRAQKP